MDDYDYDLFTIGAGSGGVRASRIAAGYGARAAVAESTHLGGTCVNVGCVPKKLLVYGSQFSDAFEDADGFGWSVGARDFDWPRLIANKDKEIRRLNGVYRQLLQGAGVDIHQGRAHLVDAHTVDVAGERFRARNILIGTGGRPFMPDVPGASLAFTSDDAFYLKELPRKVVIIGGGYIAVEFAGIFKGMGCDVTLLYRGEMILRGFDSDVRKTLTTEMHKRGIDVRCHAPIAAIEEQGARKIVVTENGERFEADGVLAAAGRTPNTQGLGLEEVGVELDANGAVGVDAYSRTSVDHIYAVGDCTDRINLTPVAIAEGQAVAETLFNGNPTAVDHTNVPSAVFSRPAVGTVGLTEEQAWEHCNRVDVYLNEFRPMKHTLTGRDEGSMIKLLVDGDTQRVLGCHIVDEEAAEIIQGFAVAIHMGATKAQLDATIGVHPTAAEEIVTMRKKVRVAMN